jgi:hypothetical protein
MRVFRIHSVQSVSCILFFLLAGAISPLQAQIKKASLKKSVVQESKQAKDTVNIIKSAVKDNESGEQPDTNFTYERYADFLSKIGDTSKYIVLPINEFRKRIDSNKIVIGLRHDVDLDLGKAVLFSEVEKNAGFRSTYFILHTADYYLANPANKTIHNENIIPILKYMQNESGFEIGWHNDLVTLQVVYGIDPVMFLHQELNWLRDNGIKIYGTASHGSNYCKTYLYVNFYFFYECTNPPWGQGIYVNNITVPVGSNKITINKGHLSDFSLQYEAYFLNNNLYYSDASFISGKRWNIDMLDLNTLKKGDRVIILLHPIHWHQASTHAEIESFTISGQKSSSINMQNTTINVVMPYGFDKSNLVPTFSLSPGAYVRVFGALQNSGVSLHNFNNLVTYTVYAENRTIQKNWTVTVENAKNSACAIESFSIPGYTKKVSIDRVRKTVFVKVYSSSELSDLPVQFRLSQGATAWIGSDQQRSNAGTVNFTQPVIYKIIAEDGLTYSQWKVTVEKVNNQADILSFALPEMSNSSVFDTVNRNIQVEVKYGQPLNSIPALFQLSANARAIVNGVEQISGLSVNDFTTPVIYNVVAEDSITVRNWTANVTQQVLHDNETDQGVPALKIYPNPARGKAIITLQNIVAPESRIEIFNSLGARVHLSIVESTGTYVEEVDLSVFTSGIYIVKCSSVRNPVIFFLEKDK